MNKEKSSSVSVPTGLHLQSRFFAATQKLWYRLGKLETSVLADELEQVSIRKPIYVASLARSGTTILTEMLEKHPDVTSHRYSDFPNIWTPFWRNYLLQKTRQQTPEIAERAHKDRIQISNDSPEAIEEVLWMNFFPSCHQEGVNNTLDGEVANEAFESFYRDHIRKLLLVRNSTRYLAKGNYNVGRFAYILKLFPDARFVVPYRNPINHIASLVKQHRFFLKAQETDPRIGKQLAFTGHLEFGPYRSAIHFGNNANHQAIKQAWADGREVEGWALYWAETYRYLLDQARTNEAVKQACRFFSYEELCDNSEQSIDRVVEHCELDPHTFTSVREYYSDHLSPPDYYRPDFDNTEKAIIEEICGPVVSELDNS